MRNGVWKLVATPVVVLALLLAVSGCTGRAGVGPQGQAVGAAGATVSVDAALVELAQLPAPEGVDPALFARLKAALHDALLARAGGKLAAMPPTGTASQVNDLALTGEEPPYALTWHHRSQGDYNQDGVVSIADVTPIAIHFGETVPGDDTAHVSIQAVVDGNQDGTVSISDVTPIAMRFGVEVHRYVIENSLTEGVDWSEVSRVAPADGTGTGRKLFTFSLDSPAERELYRVRPVDSGEVFGDASNAVRFFTGELLLRLDTPAETGAGTPDDPYVVLLDTPYQLKVIEDPSGAAIDRTEEACFETMPPAFITFSTDVNGLMTVDNVMAGDFWVVGLLGELAPLSTARVYFRVLGDLPL